MSRVAEGHFRRKREAPLILRGSTSQFRGHPRMLAQAGFLHLSCFVTVPPSDLIELHYPPEITPIGAVVLPNRLRRLSVSSHI